MLFLANSASADTNDPAAIEQRLKALEATPERQTLVREPVSQARKALKRVLDARAAGDAPHAIQLAELAKDWATLAANVAKAAELEKEVAALQVKLIELDQKRRRTETLLEATIAQRERTRQELSRSSTPGPVTEPDSQVEQKVQSKTAASSKRGPASAAPAGASRAPAPASAIPPASAPSPAAAPRVPAAPQEKNPTTGTSDTKGKR